jgi:hypothetical protein
MCNDTFFFKLHSPSHFAEQGSYSEANGGSFGQEFSHFVDTARVQKFSKNLEATAEFLSKFRSNGPQILDATIQNVVAPVFVHPRFIVFPQIP